MDFSLSQDQTEFKEAVVRFAQKKLVDDLSAREKRGEFFLDGWRECADFGLLGLPVPEEYGGLGMDALTCLLSLEGLSYGCRDNGLVFAINSHLWTCVKPILSFGSVAQKERFLPALVRGEMIGGHAMTEPEAGSDAFGMRCQARKEGDRYILNGTKIFITNAPIADLLLVFAVTDPDRSFGGISAFIVEKGFPGFSVGRPLELMGLKTCPIGEVILQDCEVPEENRLGKEGAGTAIFNAEMEWERGCLFAAHLGAMERELEACVSYAGERHQFGRPIGSNQAVSHRIADMAVRIELSRMILYKVAWMKDQGMRAPKDSAIAKLFVSESYVHNSLDALQLHGAYGYSTEYEPERHVRDSLAGRIYSGTSEIQRNIIASFYNL
ncbi:MAG: acyl-CoA dehydrogenase [Desulfuromonas sp.]|uniref:acyl-CoA dehydrogenase family protein n=1 Tax=Desulfuromonas sp. TaxID=892 RepID=UPI000CAE8BA1|nr:acyl-CoA dehydrogenase family protein [Desulfuromonas sp.]PLX82013.1 MAG: acyl-CoA dehydrogenase [Desulfuromonas sp.]